MAIGPSGGHDHAIGGGRREISHELDDLLSVAREAARAGARAAMWWREHADQLRVEEKVASDDLVSQADRDAERSIRSVIARHRPDDAVLGEEDGAITGTTNIQWVVDPLDGTTNYLYDRPDWAVSVAALGAGDAHILVGVVAEPVHDRLTEARLGGGTWVHGQRLRCRPAPDPTRALVEINLGRPAQRALAGRLVDALVPRVRDVRRGGSAACALAQVASGRADAYWGPGLQSWDGAAGLLLVSEAGGSVGDLAGRSAAWPPGGDILATAPDLWEPLRALIAEVHAA